MEELEVQDYYLGYDHIYYVAPGTERPEPGAVENLRLDLGATVVQVMWNVPTTGTNDGNTYFVYRDGTKIAQTTNTEYTDKGVTRGTEYTWKVYAINQYAGRGPEQEVTGTTLNAVSSSQQPIVQAISSGHVQITNVQAGLEYYSSPSSSFSTTKINNTENIAVPVGETTIYAAYPNAVEIELVQGTPVSLKTIKKDCPTGGTYQCNCHSCGSHPCNCSTRCASCGCGCNGDCGCSWGQCGCPSDMWWYNPQQHCDTCSSTCCDQCPNIGECSPPSGYVKAYNQWWKISNPTKGAFVLEEQSTKETFAPATFAVDVNSGVFITLNTKVRSITDASFQYALEDKSYTFINEKTGKEDVGWVTKPNEDGSPGGTKVQFPRIYLINEEDERQQRFEFDEVILSVFDGDGELIDMASLSDVEDDNTFVITVVDGKYALSIDQPEDGKIFKLEFIADEKISKSVTRRYAEGNLEVSL